MTCGNCYNKCLFFIGVLVIICFRKILRDAVPIINTEASVALISEMLLAGKAMELEADIWLTSLAFIGKPTIAMLSYVAVRLPLMLM